MFMILNENFKASKKPFQIIFFQNYFWKKRKNRTKNVLPKIEKGTNLACSIYSRINTGILRVFFRKNTHGNIREAVSSTKCPLPNIYKFRV